MYFEELGDDRPSRELDAIVAERFPDEDAFDAALPEVLRGLGFGDDEAEFLGTRIDVEVPEARAMRSGRRCPNSQLASHQPVARHPGLGWLRYGDARTWALPRAGDFHASPPSRPAWGAEHRMQKPLPSCTSTKPGRSLASQVRRSSRRHRRGHQHAQCVPDCGTGLAGDSHWRWLYEHPEATPAELRDEVVAEAGRVGSIRRDRHGDDPYHLMAAYEHSVAYPLYLADYVIGLVMAQQIRTFVEGRDLAEETMRICGISRVTPDAWMQEAVGAVWMPPRCSIGSRPPPSVCVTENPKKTTTDAASASVASSQSGEWS